MRCQRVVLLFATVVKRYIRKCAGVADRWSSHFLPHSLRIPGKYPLLDKSWNTHLFSVYFHIKKIKIRLILLLYCDEALLPAKEMTLEESNKGFNCTKDLNVFCLIKYIAHNANGQKACLH